MNTGKLWQMLDAAADEMGWNTDSKFFLVMGFLEGELDNDPLLAERFQKFLDEECEAETAEPEEEEEEDWDQDERGDFQDDEWDDDREDIQPGDMHYWRWLAA